MFSLELDDLDIASDLLRSAHTLFGHSPFGTVAIRLRNPQNGCRNRRCPQPLRIQLNGGGGTATKAVGPWERWSHLPGRR